MTRAGSWAGSWRGHVAALGIYSALSIACIDHGVSITDHILGIGSDPFIFIWFLAWWPFAFAHHLNLLWTDLLWHPVGVSIPWVTSIPGIALPMMPVTLLWGPVISFNLVMIAAPALDAWAAFALCRVMTGRFAPSCIAGFVYGFSGYVMSQDVSAMNLSLVICPPLLLLVTWARLNGILSRAPAIVLATALLILQFSISIETAALMLFFGGITWLFAFLYLSARRAALMMLVRDGLIVGVAFCVLLSPVLWAMFVTRHVLLLPAAWKFYFTADLLNFVVPTPETFWGALWRPIPPRFHGELNEINAYLGLPLFGIIIAFARGVPQFRWLIVVLLTLLIASLGPFLWIGGWFSDIAMPWLPFSYLPLLGDALPARFAVFVALAASIILALWLSDGPRQRYFWAALVMVDLAPAAHPIQAVPQSAFFAPGQVSMALGPNPRLLILPFSIQGPSCYWQVESRFSFTQTGGYVGYPPAPVQVYPAVAQLFGDQLAPTFATDIENFVISSATEFIVVGPGTAPSVRAAVLGIGWPSRRIDDVTIVTVPKNG